ncbi:hypothetical protein ACWD01_24160, partial [Streptomyces sp. NPDC002835]
YKDEYKGKDKGGKPHGGMHTGGGALASVSEDHKDWDKDEHKDKDEYKGKDKGGKPHGGMHTGGGALATVTNDDWDKDKDESGKSEKSEGWKGEKSEGWKGEKPSGGMHTGGGGLASSGSGMAAGSLLLLGGLGAGAYMLRRRSANGSAA